MQTFEVRLLELQPSQIYVSLAKLKTVEYMLYCGCGKTFLPVTVARFENQLILTEGHTRALALYLQGYQTISAIWEPLPLTEKMYQQCLRWCQDAEVFSVADLAPRIIEHETFEILWLQRCRQEQQQLGFEGKQFP